jgi:hypothetical protein
MSLSLFFLRYKYLLIGLGIAFVCFLGVMGWGLRQLPYAFGWARYKGYVYEYLETQKQKTGKWPSDLNGLPGALEADAKKTGNTERWQKLREFHKNEYQSIEKVSEDKNQAVYRIHLRTETKELGPSLSTYSDAPSR